MLRMSALVAAMAASVLFASEKYYLEPEQIALTNETIYVQFEDHLVETDTLLVDQGGIYVCSESMRCQECHRSLLIDTECHKRLNPKNTCHKRLNPKNTCHKRLNPKNTCEVT